MNNFDIFILKNIIVFMDNNEYMSLSEVSKNFNNAISFLLLRSRFPRKRLIYSSQSYIEYIYDHNFSQFSYIHAISYNCSIEVLEWLYNNTKLNLDKNVFNTALQKGNIDTLNWLKDKKCLYDINILSYTMMYNKDIINWMNKNLYWLEEDLFPLVRNNNYDALSWVIKCVPSITYKLIDIISEIGNLNMLEWAYNLNYKFSTVSCANASRNGHFEILKWLRNKNCPWDAWTLTDAITGDHYDIVKWCLDNGCEINEHSVIEAKKKPCIYKLLLR